jgi:Asp-tRNA(Asn)/Glu-tRNA(Gln) amidotransferase A subunit family amidase
MSDKSPSRRSFLRTVPAAVAGAVGAKAWAQTPASPTQGTIKPETIECAESIPGLDFHADEEAAMAQSMNQRLRNYQQLREMAIPADTELAIGFRPSLPGKEPKGPATPGAPIKYSRPLALKRPPDLESVAFWPVASLASLVQRKLVTSSELTKMYLARLKRYQPRLNFYVTLTEELALKQAAVADREIGQGKYRGPLHGIPWGAKDLYATKGIKTTWGGEPYVDQVIDYDATVVERLRDAGAVLVAKLTLGALAQGDQWFGGQTKDPWNPELGSSGSSAGPGSATAAGCVGFSLGTETRGSIISPAIRNGVVGLRPTYGRVSRYGAMALANTMDKVGPLCRYVEDCVLVLNAIYGPDKRDASVADAAFHWNPDAPLSQFRVAYVRTQFENARASDAGAARGAGGAAPGRGAMPAEDRIRMYQSVLDVYRRLGTRLEPIDLPDLSIANAIGFILDAEAAASFDDITRSGDIEKLRTGTSKSTWPNTFKSSRFIPAVEYLRAQRARTLLMRQMDGLMSKYDVVVSAGSDSTLPVTNLTGHPAISLKCGMFGGQPQEAMITGRLYDEATLCRIALAYEQATEWKDRHPSLPA